MLTSAHLCLTDQRHQLSYIPHTPMSTTVRQNTNMASHPSCLLSCKGVNSALWQARIKLLQCLFKSLEPRGELILRVGNHISASSDCFENILLQHASNMMLTTRDEHDKLITHLRSQMTMMGQHYSTRCDLIVSSSSPWSWLQCLPGPSP